MAQDTTRPSSRQQSTPGNKTDARDRGAQASEQGASQDYGTAPGGGQRGVSQRHPARTEGRSMTTPRGGAMAPYGGAYASPFELMQRMSDEMDRIFESFGFGPSPFGRTGPRAMTPFAGFGSPGNWGGGLAQAWSPRIEVCERDGRLLVEADLPGVKREDLSVQVDQDAIVIEGQRKQEETTNERGYFHSERSYGSFSRTIPLPEGADADNARARFRDGVLEVEVPMLQRTRGRRLEIQSSTGEGGDEAPGGRTYEGSTSGGPGAGAPSTGVSGGGSSGGSAGSV